MCLITPALGNSRVLTLPISGPPKPLITLNVANLLSCPLNATEDGVLGTSLKNSLVQVVIMHSPGAALKWDSLPTSDFTGPEPVLGPQNLRPHSLHTLPQQDQPNTTRGRKGG